VKLLPSCWPDPNFGVNEWIPGSPIRKSEDLVPEQEVKQPTKVQNVEQLTPVIQQVQHVVEQPPIVNRPLPEVIVEKDFEDKGERMHMVGFSEGSLGVEVLPDSGAIVKVEAGSLFAQAQVKEGWFIRQVCGEPFSFALLQDAEAGKCSKYPYSIVFGEGVVAEVPLQDDTAGMKMSMKSNPQQEGIIKVFNIKSPKTNVGLGYIFKNNNGLDSWGMKAAMFVSEQGVVQKSWADIPRKYTKDMGIILEPGDEILNVNDKNWEDLVVDKQFKEWAIAGALGKLTFLILKA